MEDIFGTCLNVKVTVGDVLVAQNFVVQENSTYRIILGQPYITTIRMKTKVIDNGWTFFRIKSQDGRKIIQFLIVSSNYKSNKEYMWEHLVVKEDNFFLGFLDKTFKGRSWNGLESK